MKTTKDTPLIQDIASTIDAMKRCIASGNTFAEKHEERLHDIEEDWLPSGSGIDNGIKIDREKSTATKVVLTFSFHHMNQHGYYDGWSDYTAIITPVFNGFDMRITGRDRNDIKDYLYQTLYCVLSQNTRVWCDECAHAVWLVGPYSNETQCAHNHVIA